MRASRWRRSSLQSTVAWFACRETALSAPAPSEWRDDGELPFFHFHEFNAISGVDPERGAHACWDGDLPF
jgi:hypothetical protein